MKNFIALILSCAFFNSCNIADKQHEIHEKNQTPNEYMYNQRAYPDNIINREAIRSGIEIVQSKKKLRKNNQGGDWLQAGKLNAGGRITDIAIHPLNDNTFYVGTAAGGVFKTTNAGDTWDPIFDDIGSPSIGNLAIAPSNPEVIYVGTGEANPAFSTGATFGSGIYRSNDAGESWDNIGLPDSNHIGRIVVDPTNEDRVFVAATGILYGTNEERGIYRTEDGGVTWEKVLYIGDQTAAIDVTINPENTNILFAAMWERLSGVGGSLGGLTSAIHRSLDGGNTWEELGFANGLPAPDENTERISLALNPTNPSTLYARFTTDGSPWDFNGLYKTTDNGDNWVLIALEELENVDSNFGWFFGNLRVNPHNENQIYVLGQSLYRSEDGGEQWNPVSGMHVDHHAMEFSKTNPDFIIAGNDGGLYTSNDAGITWSKFNNLPITQFYNIEVDYQNPERLYGGTQDNNTIRTSNSETNDWSVIWLGDGFHVNVDPVNNYYIYVEKQYGFMGRSINGGSIFNSANDGIDPSDRKNWNTPIIISPYNHQKVYYGSNRLYISDYAETWSPISQDLTNGVATNGTLSAIAPSYKNLNVIYTGSTDGKVQVTFDGGTSWSDVTNNLPNRYVTSIAISPSDDLIAYVTLSGYRNLDYTPHVFKTEDGGQNWIDISSNLPSVPANDIILNSFEEVLFLATDLNVWYSENDGDSWELLGANLPITVINDLKLHEPTEMLYAGTHGRSLFSINVSDLITLNTDNYNLSTEDVIVYPNPTRGKTIIKHPFNEFGNVTLFDINGRKMEELFTGELKKEIPINISVQNYARGIYFIKISGTKTTLVKRLQIK